jgi:small neutral amino acid transporter SnatA (MarC family)
VSISELTTASGWIAGLAIVALIAAGWRKPARATADPARALRRPTSRRAPVPVAALPTPLYRGPRWWRRMWAVAAGSTLSIVVGALMAIAIAATVSWTVVTLTSMLRH